MMLWGHQHSIILGSHGGGRTGVSNYMEIRKKEIDRRIDRQRIGYREREKERWIESVQETDRQKERGRGSELERERERERDREQYGKR